MTSVQPSETALETLSTDENQPCKKCALPISEGHAYDIGGDRWHIECFTCSKCLKLLGCQSDFLVLGTGDLVCLSCLYLCHLCSKKIDDLAILTGNQAYCSSCFKCRSCKKRIEDLRYARTSKGLFCMACHEKLIARKRKYDSKKEVMERANAKSRETLPARDPKIQTDSATCLPLDAAQNPSTLSLSSSKDLLTANLAPFNPASAPPPGLATPETESTPISQSSTPISSSASTNTHAELSRALEEKAGSHRSPVQDGRLSTPLTEAQTVARGLAAPVVDEVPTRSPNRKFTPLFLAPPVDIGTLASSHDGSASPTTPEEPFFLLPAPKGQRATPLQALSPHRPPPSPMAHINRKAHIISSNDAITLDYKGEVAASSVYEFVSAYSPEEKHPGLAGLGLLSPGRKERRPSFEAGTEKASGSLEDTGDAASRTPLALAGGRLHRKQSSVSSTISEESLTHRLSHLSTPPRNAFRLASRTLPTTSAGVSAVPPLAPQTSSPYSHIQTPPRMAHNRSTSDSVHLGEPSRTEAELRGAKADIRSLIAQRTDLEAEVGRMIQDKETLLTEVGDLKQEVEGLQIMMEELNLQVEILREVSLSKRRELEDISKAAMRPRPKSARASPVLETFKFSSQVEELEPVPENSVELEAAPRAKARFWRKPRLGEEESKGLGSKGFSILPKSKSINMLDAQSGDPAVFGGTLTERAVSERRPVPFVLTRCMEVVEQYGLDHVGIYRVSGGSSQVDKLEKFFLDMPASGDTRIQAALSHSLTAEDINAVPSVLKRYLRKLRDPLITYALYDAFIAIARADQSLRLTAARLLASRLPPTNRVCLESLSRHLHIVAARADENKMHLKNLSMVFAPTIAWDRAGEREMEDMAARNESTEFLITHYKEVMAEFSAPSSSGLLGHGSDVV